MQLIRLFSHGSVTRSQFIFFVLPDCEVFRILLPQVLKHNIHGILELFIILPDLHGVDEIDQGCDFLFLIYYCFPVRFRENKQKV